MEFLEEKVVIFQSLNICKGGTVGTSPRFLSHHEDSQIGSCSAKRAGEEESHGSIWSDGEASEGGGEEGG